MPQTRTCTKCAAENPPAAQFCMACGERLDRVCPGCGAPALPGARFCVECGTALAPPPEPDAAEAVTDAAAPGSALTHEERRTVTVLFADLSGYTAIAERL